MKNGLNILRIILFNTKAMWIVAWHLGFRVAHVFLPSFLPSIMHDEWIPNHPGHILPGQFLAWCCSSVMPIPWIGYFCSAERWPCLSSPAWILWILLFHFLLQIPFEPLVPKFIKTSTKMHKLLDKMHFSKAPSNGRWRELDFLTLGKDGLVQFQR